MNMGCYLRQVILQIAGGTIINEICFAAVRTKVVQMRKLATLACFALMFNLQANSQADVPKFTVEVRNTFIWGEDVPAGAISSSVKEPLTGAEILTLKHDGVAVTSRMGFEKLHRED